MKQPTETPKINIDALSGVIKKLCSAVDPNRLTPQDQQVLEAFNRRVSLDAVYLTNTMVLSDWINMDDRILCVYFTDIKKSTRTPTNSGVYWIILYKVTLMDVYQSAFGAVCQKELRIRYFKANYANTDAAPRLEFYDKGAPSPHPVFMNPQKFNHTSPNPSTRAYRFPKDVYPGDQAMEELLCLLQGSREEVQLALSFMKGFTHPLRGPTTTIDYDAFYQIPEDILQDS